MKKLYRNHEYAIFNSGSHENCYKTLKLKLKRQLVKIKKVIISERVARVGNFYLYTLEYIKK